MCGVMGGCGGECRLRVECADNAGSRWQGVVKQWGPETGQPRLSNSLWNVAGVMCNLGHLVALGGGNYGL